MSYGVVKGPFNSNAYSTSTSVGRIFIVKRGDVMKFFLSLTTILLMPFSVYAYDPMDCIQDAVKVYPKFTNGLVTRLCSGAWSSEPVKCFANIPDVDKEITIGISVDLCAGSIDANKTIACYNKAASTFNRGLATTLCGMKK